VDSGADFSSDDSGSDTRHEASSATTSTCAVLPGVSSSNEGKKKNTVIDRGDAGEPAPNSQEHQDSSWLNIDQFSDNHPGFDDRAAEDRCQKMGDIEDPSGSDGQAEDEYQDMDYYVKWAEDGHGDEDEVAHSKEDVVADSETNGIEVDGDGSHSDYSHGAKVGGGGDGQ